MAPDARARLRVQRDMNELAILQPFRKYFPSMEVVEIPGTIELDVYEPEPPLLQFEPATQSRFTEITDPLEIYERSKGGRAVMSRPVIERGLRAFTVMEAGLGLQWSSSHDFRRLQAEVAAGATFLDACGRLINLLQYIRLPEEDVFAPVLEERFTVLRDGERGIKDEILSRLVQGIPIDSFGILARIPQLVEVSFDVLELSFASPLKLSLRSMVKILTSGLTAAQLAVSPAQLYVDTQKVQESRLTRGRIELSYDAAKKSRMEKYLGNMRMGGLRTIQSYLKSLELLSGRA